MLSAQPTKSEKIVESNELVHRSLASGNARRFAPRRSAGDFDAELEQDVTMRRIERTFVEAERATIKNEASKVPTDAARFVAWFESLTETHCSATDALSSWLASEATSEQVESFNARARSQNVSLKDLLALTQVNMPNSSKLELARNYWEEMSQDDQPLFQRRPSPLVKTVAQPAAWEALAVDNLMVALATARHYAYQSLGALSIVEHPGRHQSAHWSREVLAPMVSNDPSLAPLIAEGALMRLRLVARRDARYLQLLEQSSLLVAEFEYAEDCSTTAPATAMPVAAPAVRPVRWRDVSARVPH